MDRRQWIDGLFRSHAEGLFRYLRSFRLPADDAYDLVQTVFLRLLEMKPTEIRQPKAWLYSVGRRLAIDRWRRERGRKDSVGVSEIPDPSPNPEDLVMRQEESHQLGQAFARMTENDRELLRLRWEHEFSHAEIARVLGKSEISVRVALHRARKELKRKLGEDRPEPEKSGGFSP